MKVLPETYTACVTDEDALAVTKKLARQKDWGYTLVNVNPCRDNQGDKDQMIFLQEGIINIRFCQAERQQDISTEVLKLMLNLQSQQVTTGYRVLYKRLYGNQSFRSNETGKQSFIRVNINFLLIFPHLPLPQEVLADADDAMGKFLRESCLFQEQYEQLLLEPLAVLRQALQVKEKNVTGEPLRLNDDNIDAILQRLAPEYTLLHPARVTDPENRKGADNKTLVITDEDQCAQAFRLDNRQIGYVNRILKGNQLILACAGSGKSVILLAKCIKAAEMNPDKHFLLTCYGRNLAYHYRWMLDMAGLMKKNVELCTVNQLFLKLLGQRASHTDEKKKIDANAEQVWQLLQEGELEQRYYGIFIDEIQLFHQLWYQICYQLLEHKESEDHLFIICGDRTQDIRSSQKRSSAPWNAGDDYPKYNRGRVLGSTLTLKMNYRNSPLIDRFIRDYVAGARSLMENLSEENHLDPEMFMLSEKVRETSEASEVWLQPLSVHSNVGEAREVLQLVQRVHQQYHVPYDDIAVITYNKRYKNTKDLTQWQDDTYDILSALQQVFSSAGIPARYLYAENNIHRQDESSVAFISCQSALGLDFEAVILCGLKPLGTYDKSRYNFADIGTLSEEALDEMQKQINAVYVALTRARRFLGIIQPDSSDDSVYMHLLEHAAEQIRQED